MQALPVALLLKSQFKTPLGDGESFWGTHRTSRRGSVEFVRALNCDILSSRSMGGV